MTPMATIKYVRRIPREQYGHEELEISLSVPAEDVVKASVDAKHIVSATLRMSEQEAFHLSKNMSEDAEQAAAKTQGTGGSGLIEFEETEVEKSAVEEAPVPTPSEPVKEDPKKRGRKAKSETLTKPKAKVEEAPVVEPEVEKEDDEDYFEDEEEVVPEPKKKKLKKVVTTPYDRANALHKNEFKNLLEAKDKNWKKNFGKDKITKASHDLHGQEFMDEEGIVLPEFKEKLFQALK